MGSQPTLKKPESLVGLKRNTGENEGRGGEVPRLVDCAVDYVQLCTSRDRV